MAGLLPPVIATLLADTKEYSAKMDEATGKMAAFGKAGDTTGQKMDAFATKASTAILGVGVAVGAAALDFAYKYSEALDTVRLQTNLTTTQMAQLGKMALVTSTATATSASEIATAYGQTVKAGDSLSQSQRDVGSAAMFAKVENASLTDTLTAALGVQKLHIAGTNSVTQTLNIWTEAIKHSKLQATDLTAALGGKSLSTFAAYHVDLKTATTLLAGFANENLTGSRALLALKGGFTALDKPLETSTGKISTNALYLQKLGLSQATLASEARRPGGMLQVLSQINQAFNQNATSAQKAAGLAAAMQQIFGTSAGPAYTNIISQLPQLEKLFGTLSNTKGATKSAFEVWLSTPTGAVANFENAMKNALIPLGNLILPDATKVANWAAGLPKFFETHPLFSKTSIDLAAALLAGSLAVKIVGIGAKIASAFGFAMEAGIAATVGAAIGAAVLAVLTTGQASHFTTAAKDVQGGHWYDALTNTLGGIDNTLKGVANFLTPGLHIGNIIQPKTEPIVGPTFKKPKSTLIIKPTLRVSRG